MSQYPLTLFLLPIAKGESVNIVKNLLNKHPNVLRVVDVKLSFIFFFESVRSNHIINAFLGKCLL